jgi:citrate synthase
VTEEFSPGLEDVIATDTEVSFLDIENERVIVRGYDLIELASTVGFTDVAHLLLHGTLPSRGKHALFESGLANECALPFELLDLLGTLPAQTVPMDALRTGLSALAGFEDPEVLAATDHDRNVDKAVRILAKAPAVAVNGYLLPRGLETAVPDPSMQFAARFLSMIPGAATDDDAVAIFDRVLVCYAEHELASSTLAARVVASSLADIYAAMVAACASLKGPLHGGANEAAARMFAEIASPDRTEPYLLEKLAAHERVMGFGHRVYKDRADPRAVLLRTDLDGMVARSPDAARMVDIYDRATEVMAREKGLHPNADLPIGLILSLLGIPVELFTPIFMCARIAGIGAHVIEQHDHNRLYRPRVLYIGPRDLHL